MSTYPKIQELAEEISETTDKTHKLFETKRSVLSILSQLMLFFISIVLVVILNFVFPHVNLMGFMPQGFHLSVRWLGIIPAFFLLETLRRYHDDLYTFMPHTMTHYDGRLSLNYSVPNIRYLDIRAVVVYQDIFGRLLNYGDIEIDTSAQEMTELFIEGVRSPRELAELIEGLRDLSKKSARKNAAESEISED